MIKRCAVVMVFVLCLGGCAPNPEELARLVKEDPAFRQMIATRDQMHAEVRLIKEGLLARKKALDAEVGRLRAAYDAYAKAQNLQIEKYQNAVDAYRRVLRREIDTALAQLEAKLTELEGYEKTLSDVKKVLRESKAIHLSAQEKEKWEERILMLNEKMRPLTEEIEDLKVQIRLKKRKVRFLGERGTVP